MPGLSERMAKVEGILEQMSERLNHLESRVQGLDDRIDALNGRIDTLNGRIDALGDKLDSHFRWTLAFIMGMWVTVIAAVLFK